MDETDASDDVDLVVAVKVPAHREFVAAAIDAGKTRTPSGPWASTPPGRSTCSSTTLASNEGDREGKARGDDRGLFRRLLSSRQRYVRNVVLLFR